MSDPSAFGFGKFVPGFDFLQSLASAASASKVPGSGTAGMSSWVAPTLNIEELDKRIQELKAVQFWLEQNGTALKATIQALEVQKMTLSTLQGMNVNMAELAKAFTVPPATSAHEPASGKAMSPEPPPPAQTHTQVSPARPTRGQGKAKPKQPSAKTAEKSAAVDPMQWWGSLTQQFQNIAAAAMQEAPTPTPQATAPASATGAKASKVRSTPASRTPPKNNRARRT